MSLQLFRSSSLISLIGVLYFSAHRFYTYFLDLYLSFTLFWCYCKCNFEINEFQFFNGLPSWLSCNEFTCQCRKLGSDPRVRKIPWRRKWQPTPVFFLGIFHNRGDWWATVHGIAQSWTRLRD